MDRPTFDPDRMLRGRQPLPPEIEDLAHRVIGAAIEVHRLLGPGFPEGVYEEALCHELTLRGIAHESQKKFDVMYNGQQVGQGKIDVLVETSLVIEIKSTDGFSPVFLAQGTAYLRALNLRLALVMNFNVVVLKDGLKREIL